MKERQPPIEHIIFSPLGGRRVRMNHRLGGPHGLPHPSVFSPLDKATSFMISEVEPEHSRFKKPELAPARAKKISVAAKGQSDFQNSPLRRGNVHQRSPRRGVGRCQSEAVGRRRSQPMMISPPPLSPSSPQTSLSSRKMFPPQSPNKSRETMRHAPNKSRETVRHAPSARNAAAPRSPTRSASKISLPSSSRRGVSRCQSESIAQQQQRMGAMPAPPLSPPRSPQYRLSLNEPPSPPKSPIRSVTRSASARYAASQKKFSSLSDIIAEYDMIQEEEPSQIEI